MLKKIIISISLLVLIVFVFNMFSSKDNITIYHLRKSDIGWIHLNPNTYALSQDRQHIIYSIGPSFREFKDCIIVDIKNWECSYQDGSAKIILKDGNEFTFSSDEKTQDYYTYEQIQVSFLYYYWSRLIST